MIRTAQKLITQIERFYLLWSVLLSSLPLTTDH